MIKIAPVKFSIPKGSLEEATFQATRRIMDKS